MFESNTIDVATLLETVEQQSLYTRLEAARKRRSCLAVVLFIGRFFEEEFDTPITNSLDECNREFQEVRRKCLYLERQIKVNGSPNKKR